MCGSRETRQQPLNPDRQYSCHFRAICTTLWGLYRQPNANYSYMARRPICLMIESSSAPRASIVTDRVPRWSYRTYIACFRDITPRCGSFNKRYASASMRCRTRLEQTGKPFLRVERRGLQGRAQDSGEIHSCHPYRSTIKKHISFLYPSLSRYHPKLCQLQGVMPSRQQCYQTASTSNITAIAQIELYLNWLQLNVRLLGSGYNCSHRIPALRRHLPWCRPTSTRPPTRLARSYATLRSRSGTTTSR